MRRIDHQLIRLARFGYKACKYLIEHPYDGFPTILRIAGTSAISAHTAPANEPVVNGLGRAIRPWRIAPAQPVANDKDNPADDPTVINAGNPVRQREIRLNLAHLHIG
jgi:hypothetical protein